MPIPDTTKLNRLEENLSAVAVNRTVTDLEQLERAAANIAIQGVRYPVEMEKKEVCKYSIRFTP